MDEDCCWMHNGFDDKGAHSDEWVTKTMAFFGPYFLFVKDQ
jgi:hypothetical protein